jgi:uncharacterized protein (TIGR03067 family)
LGNWAWYLSSFEGNSRAARGAGPARELRKRLYRNFTWEAVMYARSILIVAVAAVLPIAALPGEKGDADLKKLQGTWRIMRGEDQGKPVPPEKLQGNLVVIEKQTMIANDKDHKKVYVMTFKLDASRTPKALDMTITEGKDKGKTAKGIYALEGDDLKIAYSFGVDRPKQFKTKEGDKHLFFVLKRIKP